ncbi:HD domain-containing phosphohydrolase [Halomonas sp. GFAJ-1]|uniref:HD domain-containing phosphohydrolase n=1 Tax=Halomonas sp. GFAJ-1 TaxID=1118153 RepID=UPI00023A4B62|nr:HD domain-containing phosphohydrolase [Halomonas sp. GFAJ-1]AVI61803.1 phosphohydrolase [Halomonas sp. GFAJ-1]EHK61456.1 metal dependent phosphohydrolase [Halomonas sp. GFAJ-1]
MVVQQDEYESVTSASTISDYLNAMIESGGVSLCLAASGARPEPIVLMEQHSGEALVMDLSSVGYLLGRLQQGEQFFLRGQSQGKVLRTPLLSLTETRRTGGRFLCCSDYPVSIDVLQRRESFRAELRMGMVVSAAVVSADGESVQGELRDLSQDGCQIELPLTASGVLAEADGPLKLAYTFPDGTYFEVLGVARHQKTDSERHILRVGFRFANCTSDQERQIWYFVCEIEREAARYKKETQEDRQPSPLFEQAGRRTDGSELVGRRDIKRYATPTARRLVKVAAYLDAQLLLLKQGSDIDSRQLSRNADRVLTLHEEDREALLFASRCLSPEPLLVRHGIAVAVHLLDLVGSNMPRDVQKAIVASGLIHDLGKALVPQVVFKAPSFEATHRQAMSEHVSLLMDRLHNCQWLSASVAKAVIGGINERLDGSGYPGGLSGNDINELAKASAIVDVVEAMRRDRADRPARTAQQIYRHLLRHPHQFDPRWIKRYVEHFKTLPVGSLAHFSSEQLAWIVRLNKDGTPAEVVLAEGVEPPLRDTLGVSVRGDVFERLGRPVREVAVST